MTNEVSVTVSVTDDTAAGREQIVAEAEATGREAGEALTSGLQEAAGGSLQERVSSLLREGRDAEAQALTNEAPSVTGGASEQEAAAQGAMIGQSLGSAAGHSFNDTLGAQAAATVASLSARVQPEAVASGTAVGDAYAQAIRDGVISAMDLLTMSSAQLDELLGSVGQAAAGMDEQLALFTEQDAPAMLTRIEVGAQEAAAGIDELEGALARAAGQLELFNMQGGDWGNMAQRPPTQAQGPGWNEADVVNPPQVKQRMLEEAAAADTAKSSFGGLAGVMNGPLMQAFYGISTVAFLPQALAQGAQMITGLFSNAAVSASAFTQAVSQDSNAIGDNTAATIQNTLAKTSLDDLSKQLGVSQATLIEYAAGESSAQADVTAAYQAKQTALGHASDAEGVHSRAQEETGNSADRLSGALAAQKSLLDQVTASVQQAIGQDKAQSDALLAAERTNEIYNASVGALVSQMKLQAEQANMNADATLRYQQTLGPGTQAYTDMVRNQTVTLEQNAVSAQLNAVAMNEMIPVQGELSKAALGAAVDYQQAATATGLYTQALTALYGQYGATSDAQAQFTTAMANVATQVTKGKDAVDLSTDAGAKNYQASYTAAQAAEGYAEKLYQQTGNARTADAALQDMASTLDKAALKAGLTKDQVHELNVELFGVPDVKDITIAVSTSEAYRQVGNLVQWIDQQTGTVDLTVNQFGVGITGSGARFMASGGISGAASGGVRGNLVEVGEQGRELVRMPVGASVVPNANVNAMAAGAYGGWDGKITIEFAGSDGDPLWEALRHHIRARAGNGPNSVQVALGQSY